jgi:hypothetical protein
VAPAAAQDEELALAAEKAKAKRPIPSSAAKNGALVAAATLIIFFVFFAGALGYSQQKLSERVLGVVSRKVRQHLS